MIIIIVTAVETSNLTKRVFLFTVFSWALGRTHPPFSAVIMRPAYESDNSSPPNAEVKNVGGIPPLPHTSLWRGA
jgi:hypothetical protein